MAKIKIIECTAFSPEFSEMTPDSVHEVIYEEECSVWVMGKTGPVKLLDYEYKRVED